MKIFLWVEKLEFWTVQKSNFKIIFHLYFPSDSCLPCIRLPSLTTLIKTDESNLMTSSQKASWTIICYSHKSLSRGNMSHLKRLFPPRHNQWHRTWWLPQQDFRKRGWRRTQTKQDRKLFETAESIFIQFPVDLTANSLVESFLFFIEWTTKLLWVILKFPSHRKFQTILWYKAVFLLTCCHMLPAR